jgi:hypothetical protein
LQKEMIFFLPFSFVPKENSSDVQVRFHFQRKIIYHIANTYVPTVSLLFISELTMFFRESFIDMSATLAITVLLVMYTFYQSISGSIPQTAYLKFIDYWLIFCLIIPFVIFVNQSFHYLSQQETTEVEMLKRKRQNCSALTKKKLIRWGIVGLTIFFIFVYFVAAANIYNI